MTDLTDRLRDQARSIRAGYRPVTAPLLEEAAAALEAAETRESDCLAELDRTITVAWAILDALPLSVGEEVRVPFRDKLDAAREFVKKAGGWS